MNLNQLLKNILGLLFFFIFFCFNSFVFAHPGRTADDGCHYCWTNCDYWGVPYGERHCHNGVNPTPTPTPLEINIFTSYELDEENCRYTIHASWEKPFLYDRFSISAVKTESTECIDPGPLPDTSETSWKFKNLTSGKYKINLKPGNSLKWDNYYYCVTVDLPKIKATLTLREIEENGKKYIEYLSKCSISVRADNGIGYLSEKNGKVEINAKTKTLYEFIAISVDGEMTKESIYIEPINSSLVVTPTPLISEILKTETTNQKNNYLRLLLFIVLFGGGIYFLKKIIDL